MAEILFFSVINGVVYGLMLFMMASGLTLIFSMMGVLNFAHASMFMLGAYLGATVAGRVGFVAALVVVPIAVGLLGAAIEILGLRRLRGHGHVAEMLFTFGLVYLIEESVVMIWGRLPVDYRVPAWLDFPAFHAFGSAYPTHRLFMVGVSISVFAALLAMLKWTRVGLIVRAALTYPKTVSALGHNVPLVFTGLFAAGCALAALAGTVSGYALVTAPNMAQSLGAILFVVVVVGGLGSIPGAFIASLAVGLIQTMSVTLDVSVADALRAVKSDLPENAALREFVGIKLSQVAPILPYLVMVAMLLFRPKGLLGTRDV